MSKGWSEFIRTIAEYNLSTWYLLPLIQLNKFSFGDANFIDSYVNSAGTILTVELNDLRLSPGFYKHPEYIKEHMTTQYSYIWFELPAKWQKDFQLFKKGKYSKFSDDAKAMIQTWSGLKYNVDNGDGVQKTDSRLLALERSEVLRRKWEEELSTIIPGVMASRVAIAPDQELLSIPSERVYKEVP